MKFELPPLPYKKSALEPHIGARTLELHYEKHHRGYLTKLEKAIGGTPEAEKSLQEIVRTSQGSVFNNAAQIWNHTFYWESMKPGGGGKPRNSLLTAITQDFGGYQEFAQKFVEVAKGEFGSGWAWLVVGSTGKLDVISTSDAQTPITTKQVPLLTVDVWEHAYYLDYQNERERYLEAFVEHLINWDFATRNFKNVCK